MKTNRSFVLGLALVCLVPSSTLVSSRYSGPTPAVAAHANAVTYSVPVDGRIPTWQISGITVDQGTTITFQAVGTWNCAVGSLKMLRRMATPEPCCGKLPHSRRSIWAPRR